jgi:hypothetical protein
MRLVWRTGKTGEEVESYRQQSSHDSELGCYRVSHFGRTVSAREGAGAGFLQRDRSVMAAHITPGARRGATTPPRLLTPWPASAGLGMTKPCSQQSAECLRRPDAHVAERWTQAGCTDYDSETSYGQAVFREAGIYPALLR